MDLKEIIKANLEFINSKSQDEWIKLLKAIAISTMYNSKYEEAINNIKNISIHYNECGLNAIILHTSIPEYNNYRIKLCSSFIQISRQEGHTNFEEVYQIPIEALRLVVKEFSNKKESCQSGNGTDLKSDVT